ncbi:MAG: 4a-hydroxytetrahydrobiopterin dehydratase [Candidatus Riflebacteria bacterium]|nr:4a-hydroxytetrahydrobiopterin dehydratase [Candidatus Riflebacteria bacterium]
MTEHRCVPCSSDVAPLTLEQSQTYLAGLPGWELGEDGRFIVRKFSFENFVQAMDFAVKIGKIAEEMGHHPVLTIGWGFCNVKFKTAKINGLHKNDFVMASHVSQLMHRV